MKFVFACPRSISTLGLETIDAFAISRTGVTRRLCIIVVVVVLLCEKQEVGHLLKLHLMIIINQDIMAKHLELSWRLGSEIDFVPLMMLLMLQ